MNSISYAERDSTCTGEFSTEHRLVSNDYDIRIESAKWFTTGTASVQADSACILRFILPTKGNLGDARPENRGRFTDRVCDFQPLGQALFIPKGQEFQFRHGANRHKAVVCLFDPAALAPLSGLQWDWKERLNEGMLDVQSNFLQASLRSLADEVTHPGFASDVQTECLLTGVALDLYRRFFSPVSHSTVNGKLSHSQISLLDEAIEATEPGQSSLGKLARSCNMPVRRFSEQFKNTTGMTLRQYIALARIRKAKSMLLNPTILIKQISYETGFLNPASFTAAFRKEVGVTPEEFRRQACSRLAAR